MNPNPPFSKLNSLLREGFYKLDLQAIRIVMGVIQGQYLRVGDPAWLFVVAPPGTGKTTTTIMGTCGLPKVQMIGDLSENTFLSGFYGHAAPGLLEKLGTPVSKDGVTTTVGDAVLMAKDFTTVLSMRRDKRSAILGQLREIHDGEFRRSFGTGETKIWRGRITVIAAVTPILDRHYSVFSTLGERFLQVRWHRPDSPEAGEMAIGQQGQEDKMRQALQEAVADIFGQALKEPATLSAEMRRRLASIAEIVAVGRTHIFRNGFGNREIEYVPEPEANTRVAKGLAAIAKGIAALNQRGEVNEDDLQDSARVALDCLPDYRRRILLAVLKGNPVDSTGIPKTTLKRELDNLRELRMMELVEESWRPSEGLSALVSSADIQFR